MTTRSNWPFKVAGQITHSRPVLVVSEDAPANDGDLSAEDLAEIDASFSDQPKEQK